MSKTTKILAIGDIHGNTSLARKLADKAVRENVDVVILAGDLTFAKISLEGGIWHGGNNRKHESHKRQQKRNDF